VYTRKLEQHQAPAVLSGIAIFTVFGKDKIGQEEGRKEAPIWGEIIIIISG
jgi:hypothetical protein